MLFAWLKIWNYQSCEFRFFLRRQFREVLIKALILLVLCSNFGVYGRAFADQQAEGNTKTPPRTCAEVISSDRVGLSDLGRISESDLQTLKVPQLSDLLGEVVNNFESVLIRLAESTGTPSFENTVSPVEEAMFKFNLIYQALMLKKASLEAEGSQSKVTLDAEEVARLIKESQIKLRFLRADLYFNETFHKNLKLLQGNRTDPLSSEEQDIVTRYIYEIEGWHKSLETNPLLVESKLDYGAVPYDQIEVSHFYPALIVSLRRGHREVAELVEQNEEPSFENSVMAISNLASDLERVERILSIFVYNNKTAISTLEITLLESLSEKLSLKLVNSVFTNAELFDRVKAVLELESLAPDQVIEVNRLIKRFKENGLGLNSNEKARFLTLQNTLADLRARFSNNLTEKMSLKNFHFQVTNPDDLQGLDQVVIARMKKSAQELGLQGWVLDGSGLIISNVLEYAESEELRKTFWMMMVNRHVSGDQFDNQQIVTEIVKTKQATAQLLGYQNYAELTLQGRMAESPDKVMSFLDNFLSKAKPLAERELQEILEYKISKTGDSSPLAPWDTHYWIRRMKEERYQFDAKKMESYFEYQNVVAGAFGVAERLFGLSFEERKDLPVYQEDVQVFEVTRGSRRVGLLYLDMFSREGFKQEGAWMMPVRRQDRDENGDRVAPLIAMTANFTKGNDQTLLSPHDVETVFHEFGHALHGLLSDVRLSSQASPGVSKDFVEMPSQFLENYVYDWEVLQTYARDKGGNLIPESLVESYNRAKNFGAGLSLMADLRASYIDMLYFSQTGVPDIEDVGAFEDQIKDKVRLLEATGLERPFAPNFSHIMSGGYSAGYYSYLWSEVLDKDAFAAFKESGDIFNPDLARRLEALLSNGGSQEELQMYVEFRGQEPSVNHFLRARGLLHD